MFSMNAAEKSSGELGSAWQRRSNAIARGGFCPCKQGEEGKAKLLTQLYMTIPMAQNRGSPCHDHSKELLIGQEFASSIGENKHLSGRRGRGSHRAWNGLSHSLPASAAEGEDAKQPPGAVSAHPSGEKGKEG